MNISNSEYNIVDFEDKFAIKIDSDFLKTPGGFIVSHDSYRLLQHIILDLEGFRKLDASQFSYYSMYSTFKELFESNTSKMSKEQFRRYILSDGVLQACAGPEKIDQFKKWGALFRILEERSLIYPDFLQAPDPAYIEEWIGDYDSDYAKSVDELVSHFCNEFDLLSIQQKSAVITCSHVHGSIIYSILLASKKCNEIEYATAILAGRCLLPNVFPDVTISKYRKVKDTIILHANTASNFISFTLTPDIHTIDVLTAKLPNYAFLPDAAKFALIEALNRINEVKSDDYSSYIVLLGKALEVSLKENVFDPFQIKFKAKFSEQRETKIFIEENGRIENFATYLVKEPHFIELGSMLFILEKFGGKTAKNSKVLTDFFVFVDQDLQKITIAKSEFIGKAKQLSKARNYAAHSRRFTLTEAKEISETALELLSQV